MKYCRMIILALFMAGVLLFAAGCSGGSSPPGEQDPSGKKDTAEETASVRDLPEGASTEPSDQTEPDTEGGESISFTMYFVDPDSSPYAEGGRKIAELVSEATDGRIRIRVEAGSKMGERELVERAMDGELDIATCANSVLTNYIPQMNILDQAYLWENAQEAHAAVDGRLGNLIRERALTLGLHVIGFEESGFRNTFSTKPIEKIDDFRGITIRTMENKYHQAVFEAFGANPIAMPYPEVMDALREGKINACENATANCLNSGYYEVTKHITNTRHAFIYIILLMSEKAWERIPEDLTGTFMDAVQEGVEWERNRLVESNEEVRGELEALGVSFHEIDVSELKAAYQEIAREKGFMFDPEWAGAVNEAIREAAEARE